MQLKEGFSTGACAAAAAKLAVLNLFSNNKILETEVWFPEDKYFRFKANSLKKKDDFVEVTVKKFAGDDPDVTNGAIIGAKVFKNNTNRITILGGKGVGTVTKKGLAVSPGNPAINPVPQLMIRKNIEEITDQRNITVEIFVVNGEELAKKTFNKKLGIIGGISILGTTGIVKPVSVEAYLASIDVELNVAKANNIDTVILVTGRTSEKIAKSFLNFPEEAFVTMGDHIGFSLKKAVEKGFESIYIVGQFGKFTKIASGEFQTHVKYSNIYIANLINFLSESERSPDFIKLIKNTISARHVFETAVERGFDDLLKNVTKQVALNCYKFIKGKKKVKAFLVGYKGGLYAEKEIN